jgi:hypothetical protein
MEGVFARRLGSLWGRKAPWIAAGAVRITDRMSGSSVGGIAWCASQSRSQHSPEAAISRIRPALRQLIAPPEARFVSLLSRAGLCIASELARHWGLSPCFWIIKLSQRQTRLY